jgi:hypothetical protein
MPLSKDLREFVALLNSNEVEYLIVGAFAVAYHGYPRYTADLNILIRSSEQNAQRVPKTLNEFGFGALGISKEDLQSADSVIQLGFNPPFRGSVSMMHGPRARKASWRASPRSSSEEMR